MPFETPNMPLGNAWCWDQARDPSLPPNPGRYPNNFEGWYAWWLTGYQRKLPWVRVAETKRFHGFELYEPGIPGTGFPSYWSLKTAPTKSQDECLYSMDYLRYKYKSEITVACSAANAPTRGGGNGSDRRIVSGPYFVFTGPWGTDKEPQSIPFQAVEFARQIGPRIAIGIRRADDTGFGPWVNWYMILDKYTTNADVNTYGGGGANPGFSDTVISTKDTYRLGIEIECINRNQYGSFPGPMFNAKCFIDGIQVYQNTYGPLNDENAFLAGGLNRWRPNGHCRCVHCARVFGSIMGHPEFKYGRWADTWAVNAVGWDYDATERFYADNYQLTETAL